MARHPLRSLLACAALAAVAPATDAAAQVRLSLAGGPSYPLGALADEFEPGWHAQASAGFSAGLLPIGLRVDGAINRFPEEGGRFQTLSGSLNALVALPLPLVAPYVVGGVGVYSSRISDDGEEDGHDHAAEGSTTNVGANIGLGIRLGLSAFSVFAEARVHNLFSEGSATRFAPLSIGLRF